MKILTLILLAVLTLACSDNSTDANSNINLARTSPRAPSPSRDASPAALDKEKETRILQKIQEFVATSHAGWTLKGTGTVGSASPIDLHIVKGADEKIIKVNYKELNDLNGQPYIVISQISENDLTNPGSGNAEHKSEDNTSANK